MEILSEYSKKHLAVLVLPDDFTGIYFPSQVSKRILQQIVP
jgi:hypothetical protein